ncbi:hypothetical protein TSOC_010826 [Tetrabaena socialis]|uniref:BUB1 N-terminal domain-containing protein n=1 Tax=Tetrabaena socialis TaxID=47790 RepID=A0A2J7ZS80_9CHLO|nr:hypothetical protein TSOC_010826 [Tetrabaena socialis]|eukprot:PNH03126.1 hypothetical protein TSOC_010826 [Tetrabaena socialis]
MAEDDRTTGSLSWAVQLQRYLLAHSSDDAALLAQRKCLLDQLQANPASAQGWAQFLEHEEAEGLAAGRGSKVNSGLAQLYQRAIELVPRPRGVAPEAYMRLLVGHARYQWYRNEDEGRDLFKALKNQHLGDTSALLYHEWALLELQAGNTSKALSVAQKGLKERAEPRSLLEDLVAQLQGSPGAAGAAADVTGGLPERKVHFQDMASSDTNGFADGSASARRQAPPSTPGLHLKAPDPSCATANTTSTSYTHLSGGSSSSVSKSSTSMLPADLSLGLSGHPHTGLSGFAPSKSVASCLSQGSEDDTINCRSADENRTQGSLGGAGGAGAASHGGGGNTGTMTMPAGIAATLNLAAGAAAVAALGTGGGGGSSGGGNNTGNMSLGLRRFGLKSKAVRVTSGDRPAGAQQQQQQQSVGAEGASPVAGATSAAAYTPAPGPAVAASRSEYGGEPDPAGRGAFPGPAAERPSGGMLPPAAPQPAAAAAAATGPYGSVPRPRDVDAALAAAAAALGGLGAAGGEEEAEEEALSRKRRAAAEAAQSPARLVASVLLRDEGGIKRRQSPDLGPHYSGYIAAGAAAGAAAAAGGVVAAAGRPTGASNGQEERHGPLAAATPRAAAAAAAGDLLPPQLSVDGGYLAAAAPARATREPPPHPPAADG